MHRRAQRRRATRGPRHEHRQARPGASDVQHAPVLPRAARARSSQIIDGADHGEWRRCADFVDQRSRRPPLRVGLDDGRDPLRSAHPLPRRLDAASTARCPRRAPSSWSPATASAAAAPATSGPRHARRHAHDTPVRRPRREHRGRRPAGVDAETVDNAKRRGPHSLRAGGRAVTASDFERLAAEADPAIARVRCLPPEQSGKPIRLLLVPAHRTARARRSSSTTSPCPTTWSPRSSTTSTSAASSAPRSRSARPTTRASPSPP